MEDEAARLVVPMSCAVTRHPLVWDPVLEQPRVQVPSLVTLRKYGLCEVEWLQLFIRQDGTCAICKKLPETGRLNVDHDHAPGWKKLPPEERKRHVRGLCCYWCNKSYLGRGITVEKAEAMVVYLRQFASVRPPPPVKKKGIPRVKKTAGDPVGDPKIGSETEV